MLTSRRQTVGQRAQRLDAKARGAVLLALRVRQGSAEASKDESAAHWKVSRGIRLYCAFTVEGDMTIHDLNLG
jgi:hypothetical protein